MNPFQKFYPLLLIYFVLLFISYVLLSLFKIDISFMDISIFLSGALIISTIVSIIFYSGLKKNGSKAVAYTLGAIVLKLMLFMIFMASYILLTKNTSLQYILAFFVIYLSFTFYLLFTFVNVLKQKRSSSNA